MTAVSRPVVSARLPDVGSLPSAGRPYGLVRRLTQRRPRFLPARLARDPYLVYTAALGPIGIGVALLDGRPAGLAAIAVLVPVCVSIQALLGLVPADHRPLTTLGWSFLRLSVALLFVAAMVQLIGGPGSPMASLYLPVVVAAAVLGTAQAVVIGTVASLIFLVPHFVLGAGQDLGLQSVALAGSSALLAIGMRRLILALERASREVRGAMVAERRRSRQIAGLEEVGHLLVGEELSLDLFTRSLRVVVDRFGYHQVSVWLSEGDRVVLAAQIGYDALPTSFDRQTGVTGRVLRSRELAFVPDVTRDPDYVAGLDGMASEICAPLLDGGLLLGIFNVEARQVLDRTDRDLVAALAERMATAVALDRERRALAERAGVLRNLNEFNTAASATLDTDQLASTIVRQAGRVISADVVALTLLDRPTGRYRLRAIDGLSPDLVGSEIAVGEGISGRAIRDRSLVVAEGIGPAESPASVRGAVTTPYAHFAAVPLIRDRVVVGALALGRYAADRPFRTLEREALELLAGHTALTVANAFLHAEVEELAIRDALTGLHNRRYFDEAFERVLAGWRRASKRSRKPLAVITFDLDNFGLFNKRHGHQVGDAVLKTFADVLRSRLRASDLVARLGGEEFIVVMEAAGRADAVRVAEEIRAALAAHPVPSESGEPLAVTVSAGVTEIDPEVPTREQLLRTADVALFMAKRGGRNLVVAA